MEAFRTADLTHLGLSAAADGKTMHYHVHDRRTGRLYLVESEIARAIQFARAIRAGSPVQSEDARSLMTRLGGFLNGLYTGLAREKSVKRPFNPLFVQIPLIDLGQFQPKLAGLARALVGPQFWWLFAALLGTAIYIASSQHWIILDQAGQIFSLSALASFALVAPFLKLLHEMGHLLVATKYGVRVRKGGLYLLGLYPMPFVDCSLADISANRNQRMTISLAGLYVDLLVAIIALIAWHFAPGGFGKTLLANIFFFSSLNSVMFNANPLVKLDGYYALADYLGQRNLGTRAQTQLRSGWRWVTTFGAEGNPPRQRGQIALAGFGFASVVYRFNVLLTIAWIMLPRFFGFGLILVAWAGYVLFLSSLFAQRAAPAAQADAKPSRRNLFHLGLLGVVMASLVFVRFPYRVVIPLNLDLANQYDVAIAELGPSQVQILYVAPPGPITKGTLIWRAKSLDLSQEEAVLQAEKAYLELAGEAVEGLKPEELIAARQRSDLIDAQISANAVQLGALEGRAMTDGNFAPSNLVMPGVSLRAGESLGALLPDTGDSLLRGQFPAKYVEPFRNLDTALSLRINQSYPDAAEITEFSLVQISSTDLETGVRSFEFEVAVTLPPAQMAAAEVNLRFAIGNQPLWRHLKFTLSGLVQRYWDARILANEA